MVLEAIGETLLFLCLRWLLWVLGGIYEKMFVGGKQTIILVEVDVSIFFLHFININKLIKLVHGGRVLQKGIAKKCKML